MKGGNAMEQTEENRAGSPESSNPVQGFKFIIILNNLTLNLKESIDCVIQYSFLNHPNETSGPAFTIDHPGVKGKEIPNLGFKEFKLHDLHRKPEMIEILESQPLEIKVSNGSKNLVGTAIFQMSKLLSPEAEKMSFGFRLKQEVPILSPDNESTIGTIDCNFCLETEDCIFQRVSNTETCKAKPQM